MNATTTIAKFRYDVNGIIDLLVAGHLFESLYAEASCERNFQEHTNVENRLIIEGRSPQSRYCSLFFCMAATILSGVMGSSVILTPTASWMALATAAMVGTLACSPTPLAP